MSDYDKRVIMGFGIPTRKSESDCADSRQWEIFLVAANNAFATENNVVLRPSNHETRNFSVVQESLLQNRTRWFEVNRNEYVKICPLNFTEKGTWLFAFQAELDSLNCLCLFTDEFTRSVAALYIPDTSKKNLIDTNIRPKSRLSVVF